MSAVQRTAQRGLQVEQINLTAVHASITPEHGVVLVELLERVIAQGEKFHPAYIAWQCASVNQKMLRYVEEVIGYRPILTVGHVSYEGKVIVGGGSEDLYTMSRTGGYHVWMTLPWMEIIDFTLTVSIAVLKQSPMESISPLAGTPRLLHPFSWQPLYVGAAATSILLSSEGIIN